MPFRITIDDVTVVTGPSATGGAVTGVLAPGVVALGVVALGAGVVVAVPGEVTEAGRVTDVATALAGEPEFPASLTRAAASTASANAATTATATIGAFQFEEDATRVRAAAPQRRHHSWSGWSGAPHIGQESSADAGTVGATAPEGPLSGSGAEAPLTPPAVSGISPGLGGRVRIGLGTLALA